MCLYLSVYLSLSSVVELKFTFVVLFDHVIVFVFKRRRLLQMSCLPLLSSFVLLHNWGGKDIEYCLEYNITW